MENCSENYQKTNNMMSDEIKMWIGEDETAIAHARKQRK